MDLTTKIAHERGQIPLRYYNQLNGKSAEENYRAYLLERSRSQQIEHEIEEELSQVIFEKVEELLKTLEI